MFKIKSRRDEKNGGGEFLVTWNASVGDAFSRINTLEARYPTYVPNLSQDEQRNVT